MQDYSFNLKSCLSSFMAALEEQRYYIARNMAKSPSSRSQSKSPSVVKPGDFPPPNELKRRPIHEKKQKSPQSEGQFCHESEEEEECEVDSSPNSSKLYPALDGISETSLQNKKNESKAKSLYPAIDESNGKTSYLSCGKFQLLFTVFVLFLGILFSLFSFFETSESNVQFSAINVQQLMLDLKSQFNSQPEITFRIVKPALKRVLDINSKPSAPAVITILAHHEAEDTAHRFALHIAKAVAHGKHILINDAVYENRKPREMKLEIYNKIKSEVQNDTYNVIVVDKLQKIPFEAALIFHNYCDQETARYKRAVYLLLLYVNDIIPENASGKNLDEVAMTRMRTIWNNAHSDLIDSLITRLTVSVVYIQKN